MMAFDTTYDFFLFITIDMIQSNWESISRKKKCWEILKYFSISEKVNFYSVCIV